MALLDDVESQAMTLPESQRATLATHVLESLPGVLLDDDEGLAEAARRDAELEQDPSLGITTEQLRMGLGR